MTRGKEKIMYWNYYRPYVSVAERRANALREMQKLRKKGKKIKPVEIEGREIAGSFWGKGWCDHLESFSDFENRLPRGRAYVRNGSVCHLEIAPGRIDAIVSGSELYDVAIDIKGLSGPKWKAVKKKCSGRIGSILELLQGRLSDQVMGIVSDRQNGLFPLPKEIKLSCSCPDWAIMCKHVAAVLYGVGARLDKEPELLFLLRGVDAGELITSKISIPAARAAAAGDAISDADLGGIFGVEMDEAAGAPARAGKMKTTKAASRKKKPKPKKVSSVKKAAQAKAVKKSAPAPRQRKTSAAKTGAASKVKTTKKTKRPKAVKSALKKASAALRTTSKTLKKK